jgi:glutamate-ammonia-ligase adenylyltransferase
MRTLVEWLQAQGRGLPAALRVARHVIIERLAVLDIEQQAAMSDITQAMTDLAEVSLNMALAQARTELDARHGPPLNPLGHAIDFWVVGMGKLGARELNVSSDIDLIYVYEEDGHTQGPQTLSAHEYFGRLSRELYQLIGHVTDDGQVFRMDLALRPNGNSGPPAVSLAMLEEYLQVQGREWERFAWLKSRVVAPHEAVSSGRALALRALVTPFVYRRYLDYGVFESLRQLHRKVRDEAQRRAAGRPERADDVKLSRGGIREIEFIVQLLLVVRGGQFPEMRTRSTLRALERLSSAGLMKPAKAQELAEAYTFLRRVEHRIQFLDDQQTHVLPTSEADLSWMALSLGFAPGLKPPACQLLTRLGEIRELVATEFDALLHDGRSPAAANGCKGCPGGEAQDAEALLEKLPPPLSERVKPWLNSPRVQALRDDARQRLYRLVGRSASAVNQGECSLDGALRFVDWLEPLLRRESYLALMVERPQIQRRLLRLLGLARWPMRYLMQHPGVIDELADERLVHSRFDPVAYRAELQERHEAWARSGQADEERLLDTLRRAHHAEVFRTLVRDVEGHITVEQVADELSALADATLDCALQWSWAHVKAAHRAEPRLGVIAYGKLGGKELGYGSDLDLVFVFDDSPGGDTPPGDGEDADRAAEAYAAHVRKLISWLTVRTAAGELFDIDTALRPNGNAGLLVSSMSAFERYQVGRGSNTAWTWEHQAITRARFCAGWPELAARFEAVRQAVLQAPRDPSSLLREVSEMREKVRLAQPRTRSDGLAAFDIKHSKGGMMDVEFAVQALVLLHSASHPELLGNVGNIALLERAEAAGLLPPGVGQASAKAYRELRRAQHRARLDEGPTRLSGDAMGHEQAAVRALWQAVFTR